MVLIKSENYSRMNVKCKMMQIGRTLPEFDWEISVTYCVNHFTTVWWTPSRVLNQVASIFLRKSGSWTFTSLCNGNTNLTQLSLICKNCKRETLSKPSLICCNSSLRVLNTTWTSMHWQALCLFVKLTNSQVRPAWFSISWTSSFEIISSSSSLHSESRILNTKVYKLILQCLKF